MAVTEFSLRILERKTFPLIVEEVRTAIETHYALDELVRDVTRAVRGARLSADPFTGWIGDPDKWEIDREEVVAYYEDFRCGYYNGRDEYRFPVSYLWDTDPFTTERNRFLQEQADKRQKLELEKQTRERAESEAKERRDREEYERLREKFGAR